MSRAVAAILVAAALVWGSGPGEPAAVWAAPAVAAELPPPPPAPPGAHTRTAPDLDGPHVDVRLLVDAERVAPGAAFRAGVLFTMDPGWHVYWRNPGQSALPTDIEWLPGAAKLGGLHWPAPEVFYEADGELITFGYATPVLLWSAAQAPASAGPLELAAEVHFLACKQICVPGTAQLTRVLEVAAGPARPAAGAALFDAAAAREPVPAARLGVAATPAWDAIPAAIGDPFAATIAVDPCGGPPAAANCAAWRPPDGPADEAFVYEQITGVTMRPTAVTPNADGGWTVRVEGRATPKYRGGDVVWGGLLRAVDAQGTPRVLRLRWPLALPAVAAPAAGDAPGLNPALVGGARSPADLGRPALPAPRGLRPVLPTPLPLWQILALAFLGGLILNLMPCVFPVLAIKVTAFTRLVHEERQNIVAHGAAYTGGIVGALWALAATIVGLRAAGTAVGWGFQFQEPLFMAVLGGVLVLFALNLFGVFEVGVPSAADGFPIVTPGLRRSAGEGVLAVILATPCSAPFLGTAVGFALSSSATTIVLVFTMIGLGLAAPFVALTLVPGAARVLPKPGVWMDWFKHALGFALLATAIWLVWLIGRVSGVDAMARLLVFLLVVGAAAWAYGAVQFRGSRAKAFVAALAAGAIVVAGTLTLGFAGPGAATDSGAGGATGSGAATAPAGWQPYDPSEIANALAQNRPVFVDFTAEWCITCKVNETTVLHTAAADELFAEYRVVRFIADWTRPDEQIRQALADLGRAGVPVYVLYDPRRPDEPVVLSEVLTMEGLRGALAGLGD